MLVNKIILLLAIIFIVVIILDYLQTDIYIIYIWRNGAVIGPVIKPINKIVNKPTNSYHENNKITQDFDPYSVIQDYTQNSIFIQEEPGYILTNAS